MTLIAETRTGRVRGRQDADTLMFLGIPYAAPPTDALRWCSPRPPLAWAGVRDTVMCGDAPIQTLGGAAAWLYDTAEPQSEDCLTLSIWTPSLTARLPVMLWIHGGAWRTGHGGVAATNGSALASRGDVVVVAPNYRLGALGWLAHPDLADERTGTFANWGLQDQIAALHWVRDNIAAFGGDPSNVTIFGQSAGGSSTASLAQHHPELIHKVIIQSGTLHGSPAFPNVEAAARYAETLAQRLSTSVKGLRALPAHTVHDAELALSREPGMVRRLGRAPVLPVRDGRTLTAWPRDGALPPVPLLIGTTRDEGSFWFDLVLPDGTPVPGLAPPATDADLLATIGDLVAIYRPGAADEISPETIAHAYRRAARAAGAAADPKALASALYTDIVFRLRAVETAKRHAAAGHPTFLYEYDHELAPPGHGSPHTAEIPFIFGTYAHPFFARKLGTGPEQAALSALMLHAWASFAHHGDPGGWARLTPGGGGITVLGTPGSLCRTVPSVRPEQLAVWGV